MSVVINTNSAASMAANNLSASGAMLQKSLNRLSSGSKIVDPSDDAGGLAVAMKLSAAAKRMGAVNNNIGNTVSFLQAQDGVLKVAGKVLERIGELKTLYTDPTKNSTDLANYNAEFVQLQSELTSLAAEKFNGVGLFGTAGMNVAVTADGNNGTVVNIAGTALMGSAAPTIFSDNFANLAQWPTTMGSPSVSGNKLTLAGGAGIGSSQTFSGALQVTYTVQLSGANSQVELGYLGGGVASQLSYGSQINDTAAHSVKVVFDGAGNASTYLDGSGTAVDTRSGLTGGNGLVLQNTLSNSSQVSNFSVASGAGSPSNTSSVSTASNLGSVALSTITSAIADVATYRADNGASQSRMNYASELISVNKANLEAANSRIMDVDVAAESTTLARYNILTQAGTSMLTQANQASQIALKLLG